jgi:hypothetical protein
MFLTCPVFAQVSEHSPNNYDTDPVLVNGKLYIFHLPGGTDGNQFISGSKYEDGSLLLKGIYYEGLKLNYDVYNQEVIMTYQNNSGAINQLIVPDGWLEGFFLGDRKFELYFIEPGRKKIFQVIGDDSIRVLYHWRKSLELSHVHGATNYVFSKPIRTMYLFVNSRINQYRNNKSFYTLFDPDKASKIRDYLRSNRINVRKADDGSIAAMIDFCNSM